MSVRIIFRAMASAPLVAASPAVAEVIQSEDNHFVTRDEALVETDPKATWLALISPSRWWSSEHTWTGDSSNLSLMPQASGCFCETIPEIEDEDRITLEGSAEHMRVVQAHPERALRMIGALGPLQSEPVTGVLMIALSAVENGTRIVWEYNVGGQTRYNTAEIAIAVDGVMSLQLGRLADMLGRVERAGSAMKDGPENETEISPSDDAGASEPKAPESVSVDAAFDDLTDD